MPKLQQYDPKNVPATKEFINSRWEELKKAPIKVGEVLLNFSDSDELIMQDMLSHWDSLELMNNKLMWKFGDNSKKLLNKSQFSSLFWEAKKAKVIRYSELFKKAQAFKEDSAVTERDILNWGI